MLKLPVSQLEERLTYRIAQDWASPRLDRSMIAISNPYRWITLTLTFAMILIYLDWKSGLIALLLGSVSSSVADRVNSGVLKKNTDRIRPGKKYPQIRSLGTMNYGKRSFPSNHASNTMAFALAFSFMFGWAVWILVPLSLLVGYSRIYCGAHYPLDVVAGWIIGGSWSFMFYSIFSAL